MYGTVRKRRNLQGYTPCFPRGRWAAEWINPINRYEGIREGGEESETYWCWVVSAYGAFAVSDAIFCIAHKNHSTTFMSAFHARRNLYT